MKSLPELKKMNLPHATAELVGVSITAKDGSLKSATSRDKIIASVNIYLNSFTYIEGGRCPSCGRSLTGFLIGTFEWGIAHGEGHCSACGYPCRGFHKMEYMTLNCPLPYHPSVLVKSKNGGLIK